MDEDERFTDEDWEHSIGGTHLIAERDGVIAAHASVVERTLRIGTQPLRAGYVEAVAVAPAQQRTGLGTRIMAEVGAHIRERFEIGALGTGSHDFYARLGWQLWLGPSSVMTPEGVRATPEDDGSIMVLATRSSPPLDLEAPIQCEWRPGDVW